MSLAGQREEIANVLSTINGVKGYKHRPKVFNTGDAWAIWAGSDNPAALNFQVTWEIWVIAPSDEFTAMDWTDSKHEEIADVLNEQVGIVERVEPGELRIQGGSRFAIVFTVIREA